MTTLRDALYNTHPESGSSADYGRAIVVGVVAGMMSTGMSFREAWVRMYKALPDGFRHGCLPRGWECYVVVHHNPTGDQYILNRDYRSITEEPVRGFPTLKAVDSWEGYSVLTTPDWARALPVSEFTAYWRF